MKSIDKFVLVLVASLALLLAGCGGGSSSTEPEDTGPTPEEMAMKRAEMQTEAIMTASTGVGTALDALSGSEPTQAQIDDVNEAIGDLEAALMDAADVSDAVKAGYRAQVSDAENSVMQAEDTLMAMEKEANEMEAKEMAALGKTLLKALGDDPLGHLSIGSPPVFMDGKLQIISVDGDGSNRAMVPLQAGDSAGMLGGWMGMDYAHTGPAPDKVKNEARVYTNQDKPGMQPFVKTTTDGKTVGKHALDAGEKYLTVDSATEYALVMADAFVHQGTQTHKIPDNTVALKVRGTYDGAPGEYSCATSCASTNDGKGSPERLQGTWTFTPDEGAMVSKPDEDYLYYGWWVSKDKDGEPTAASAFAGATTGLTAVDLQAMTAATENQLTGSATYSGHAAGKFAMSNALDGTGSGGHFTADANLEATFTGENPGVTGTIDNFMLNDGTDDAGWSVALHRATWTTDTFMSTAADNDMADGTTWSINGNAASESGKWSGMMYDEMSDDGSNVPTTVTGTFQSHFSAMGRMVGAFGADLDD